jgi:eukaryotic-like serine/threonine-protein kinase
MMSSDRWQRIKDLFHSALAIEAGHRATFLDKACADDPSLREEVAALLASDEGAEDFIETPPVEMAAESLASDSANAMQGRRIGPYKIIREIGRGGMGVVYLAERADEQYQKQVAIKLIKRGMDTDTILRRFHIEQQILANLDHPNIAKLLDGGTTDDHLSYFIMDYVEGLPIDLYCDTHKLPTVERLKLFCTVCEAVQYAHQHDVVHRDLKPSNIFVTAESVPKLLDFGIAKLLNPEPSSRRSELTATSLRPMTLDYASPEQVRGGPVTPASDIYSLGVVLYKLLTGHYPYRIERHTPQEIERAICETEPERPSSAIFHVEQTSNDDGRTPGIITPESVSQTRDGEPTKLRRRLVGDLDNIVLKALRKESERRYASVQHFSEDIRRHLDGRPILARKDSFWHRGAKFLKRKKDVVLAATLAAVIPVLLAMGVSLFTGRAQIDSIAVLPFVNISGDPNTEYLSEGITESLMNQLSQLANLKVIPRASVLRYKGTEQDPQAVGNTLGVQAVLMGRVVQTGNDLTISAELVDTRNNRHLWGGKYTRKPSEILVLQEDIARQISAKLTRLTTAEREQLTKRDTENPAAYREYVLGRHFWNQRSGAQVRKALQHFERAIELDPNYALAHAGIADSYIAFATFRVRPGKEAYVRARAAAVKALELNPALEEAHSVLAMVSLYHDWDWATAEREFKRAVSLKPDDATTRLRYGLALAWFDRFDEGRREIAKGLEVDPGSPLLNYSAAQILYWARRYEQAIEEYRKALSVDPNFFGTYTLLGEAYVQKGSYDEAVAAFKKAIDLGDSDLPKADLAYAYAVSGRTREARKILAELTDRSRRTYAPPFEVAIAYVGLGDHDQAFAWLEKAYQERERAMLSLRVNPRLDPLRSDPRFADLLRRVGLPP